MELTDKILIVDDNRINIKLIVKMLEEPGREILTAESGAEAIEIVKNNRDISLLIMDVQMPLMNGFETAKKIMELPECHDIPVIFISGYYKTDEYITEGFGIGAYDYIIKPFDSIPFSNKVNVFLTLFRQKKELKLKSNELSAQRKFMEKVIETVPSLLIVIDKNYNIFSGNLAENHIIIKYPELDSIYFIDLLRDEIKLAFDGAAHQSKEISIIVNNKPLYFWAAVSGIDNDKGIEELLLTITDITDRKNIELNLNAANRSLKMMSECGLALLFAQTEKELFYSFCDILTNLGNYDFVWISKALTDEKGNFNKLQPQAFSGKTEDILSRYKFEFHDLEKCNCPILKTIQNFAYTLHNNLSDCSNCPNSLCSHGFNSLVSIPLKVDKYFIGSINIYSEKQIIFDDNESSVLNDITNYLTFGIEYVQSKKG
ncbi:MAG: hypothetical protein QG635_1142 [Bacteroidota bacterium]|nr:hypothetical protein [Bacteroidota bacterium]